MDTPKGLTPEEKSMMEMLVPTLRVMKKKGSFEIIQVTQGEYCVRKTYRSMFGFGPEKKTFMQLNLNGTDMTWDHICGGITVGTYDRCEYVFNANVLKEGGI